MHARHTPRCTCNVLTHLSLSSDIPKPRPCIPVLHATATSVLACPPGRSCRLPWQCCACQQMKFALLCCSEGPRAAGGISSPCHPRLCPSSHILECCPRVVSSSYTNPAQAKGFQFWGPCASQALDLLSACVKEYPRVGHHLTIGSCLLQTKLPRTEDLPQSAPHHHTDPRLACSACRPWHLQSPLRSASSPVQGVASGAFQF